MKVIVCGDRNWINRDFIYSTLDKYPITELIEGGANGADAFAAQYAKDHGIVHHQIIAKWEEFGKGAGPIRNMQMLAIKPDLVIAFHNNIKHSRGTANILNRARRAKIPILLFKTK